MELINLFRNPIVIGIMCGLIVHIAMKYKMESEEKNKKKKQNRKLLLIIPLCVMIIIWFIAYSYLETNTEKIDLSSVVNTNDVIIKGGGCGNSILEDMLNSTKLNQPQVQTQPSMQISNNPTTIQNIPKPIQSNELPDFFMVLS